MCEDCEDEIRQLVTQGKRANAGQDFEADDENTTVSGAQGSARARGQALEVVDGRQGPSSREITKNNIPARITLREKAR